MTGWIRIGIVLTTMWAFGISSYAFYEFISFPLEPFADYVDPLTSGDVADAKKFHFVEITTKSTRETLSLDEKLKLASEIDAAKTDEDRTKLIEYRDYQQSNSTIKPEFFYVLIIPIIIGWVLCFAFGKTIVWIRDGFMADKK